MRNLRLMVVVLPIWMITTAASLAEPSEVFYSDLTKAIKNIQGKMEITLSGGYWKKTIAGADVVWNNDEDTKGLFEFNYRNGVLQKGCKLTFTPSIHIWVNRNRGLSLSLKSIQYDAAGAMMDWSVAPDNLKGGLGKAPISPSELGLFMAAIQVNNKVENLFSGDFFRGFSQPKTVNRDLTFKSQTPIIKSVSFASDGPLPSAGLSVDLMEGKKITIAESDANMNDNVVFIIGNNSHIIFQHLNYDFKAGKIEGKISDIALNLNRGGVKLGSNMSLDLMPSSSLSFTSIEFQKSRSFSYVDCIGGIIDANIGLGSRLNLTTGISNISYFSIDDNSSVHLNGVELKILNKKPAKIKIGGGSTFDINIRDAQLGFGRKGFIKFGTGSQVKGLLSGTWNSDGKPDVDLQIQDILAIINGGEIEFNNNTNVRLESGTLRSSNLLLNGLTFQGVTGEITELQIQIHENSKIGLPNGFEINSAPLGSIIAATDENPLKLNQKNVYPIGTLSMNLPFHIFKNYRQPSFDASEGNIVLNLQNFDTGKIRIFDSFLKGNFRFSNAGSEIVGSCNLFDINGEASDNLPASLTAKLSLEVKSGLNISFRTDLERKAGEESFRVFPVNLTIRSNVSTTSNVGNVTMTGNIFNIDNLIIRPAMELVVPPGFGEYQDKDDMGSADGTHPGDDQLKAAQEIYTDQYGTSPVSCTVHVYLLPRNYQFSCKLYIQTDENNKTILGIDELDLDDPFDEDVAWKKDGCDGTVIGALAGLLISAINSTILPPSVTTAAGAVAGNKLEDSIKYAQKVRILSKIDSMKKTWVLHSTH